jgi:hypothetical protein
LDDGGTKDAPPKLSGSKTKLYMPKVTFHKFVQNISGTFDGLTFYEADGQNLVRQHSSIRPERSERQQANSSRFVSAGRYASAATADPAARAVYKAACRGHQNPRNLAIRDFLSPPVIEALDLNGYAGRAGDPVRIKAIDDFEVLEMRLEIRDPEGAVIEEGLAEPVTYDKREWVYRARTDVSNGRNVSLKAIAKDRPGNTTETYRWHQW